MYFLFPVYKHGMIF